MNYKQVLELHSLLIQGREIPPDWAELVGPAALVALSAAPADMSWRDIVLVIRGFNPDFVVLADDEDGTDNFVFGSPFERSSDDKHRGSMVEGETSGSD